MTANKLPLSPTDLVQIYKEKQENENYTLTVDYEGSKEILEVDHILIYLSNTGFTTGFTSIDSKLLIRYINIDFLIDSPTLARVWANILKVKNRTELTSADIMLFELFSLTNIAQFIVEHEELITSVEKSLSSSVVAIISNAMESEPKTYESNLGPNIGYLLRDSIDSVMAIMAEQGISEEVDASIFNDKSKFFGGDIYKWMSDNGTMRLIASMLPEDHEVFTDGAFKQD